ncbi:MAG: microcystin degradation protein MlrC [Alcaligenaceae bacterium]|nr:MAG: microcystin degradation protein MlrC [Alcaligenaceae bacterium]
MKILLARLNHETNTFSPVPTPLASFGAQGPTYGEQAYAESKGTRTGIAAYIDLLEQAGHQVVVACNATANPSGRVAADAYTHLCDVIVSAATGCDAIALDLHGAMVAENSDDGEGDLLERLRSALPNAPIAVAFDLHGKITEKTMANSDIVVSFKTYPHIDMYETGAHAARLLLDMLEKKIKPTMAWRRLPLLSHTLCSRTDIGAMHEAVELARAAEAAGMLGVSVLAGFSLADIAAPCVSVVVISDADPDAAEQFADVVAGFIWDNREGFVYKSESLTASIAQAQALAQQPGSGPVLLLDHGDNCMSGGTCDDMNVLHEALAQGLQDIVVGPICDPEAVSLMIEAGIGATLSIAVGDKVPLTQLGITTTPRLLAGLVARITDGEYVISGPTYTGQRIYMGRTVLLQLPQALVLVTETPQEHWDLGIFTHIGIEAAAHRFVLLKSRMYCRPVFVPLAKAVVECDGGGVTSSDYSRFPYRNLAHPVYPFELTTTWQSQM